MVSSDTCRDIDSMLEKIFVMTPVLQLFPGKRKLILSRFLYKDTMKHLSGLKLWHLFKYVKLTEVVRQNDKLLIDLPYKVPAGNINDDVEKLLKVRFIHESNENYPKKCLEHVCRKSTCYKK